MSEPDPLADADIYQNERVKEEVAVQVNPEDTELEDDLTELLTKSMDKEKKKSCFV
jgi:hypothetical protein